jgi:hypothetical protein
MLRHGAVRLQACEPAGHGWPDRLHRRQESPAQAHLGPAPVQVAKARGRQRSSWSGAPVPSWRRLQQVMQAAPPGAGARSRLPKRGIVLLRCCILLLYQARELWVHDFEFICLTWVELRGFEPLTSCMPSTGSTSTAVRLRRSLSQEVHARPVESAPVAVLSCCTGQPALSASEWVPDQPEPPKNSTAAPSKETSIRSRQMSAQSTGGGPGSGHNHRPSPTAASPRSELPATAEPLGRRSPAGRLNARI